MGYVGARQVFTWPSSAGFNNSITAYLWGGGGAGGGWDANNQGGQGSGSGFSRITFSAVPGDVLEVSVGGPGTPGGSSASYAYGGNPGSSLVTTGEIFNSVNLPGTFRVTNPAYCTFLNNFGVWNVPGGGTAVFDYSISVNFPSSGEYTFDASVDNYGYVYLDGVEVCQAPTFTAAFSNRVFVPAGTYTLRMYGVNTGGPGSFGLVIAGGAAFSGGWGGRSGRAGSSGGGGGGGGATVLRKNGTVIGVAGGGGGGGGAGISSGTEPANAPGPFGQSSPGIDNGSDGGTRGGDGGGGGGGGGGWGGGNGGDQAPYDTWGYAGFFGGNLGNSGENPSGRTPGGTSSQFYPGGVGVGGTTRADGTPGYAVIQFDIQGTFINNNNTWSPVKQTWVNDNGVWKPAQAVYVKNNGVWEPVNGSLAPNFNIVDGAFGYASRKGPSSDDSGGDGGTGGGGKIICTKLYELGLMSKDIYLADQAFGAELVKRSPDIYNGYRAWAEIVVDWMDGQGPKMMPWMSDEEFSVAAKKWSTAWAVDIATPWAEEMACQMGVKDHGSLTGRMITAAGIPICKVVGVWQRVFGPSERPAGFGKGLMLIPIFVMFKLVAELGRAIEKIRN